MASGRKVKTTHNRIMESGEWRMENGELTGMSAFPGGLHDGNQQLDQFFVVHADGGKALGGEVFSASEG